MDYTEIERSLCVCRHCERLTSKDEARLGDGGHVCYPCAMEASGAISLQLDLVVGGGA